MGQGEMNLQTDIEISLLSSKIEELALFTRERFVIIKTFWSDLKLFIRMPLKRATLCCSL